MKEKNMKPKGQKQENKILYVALGCVLFVACLCIFAGVFLHFSNKKDAADELESAEVTALEKEAGAVSAKENATRIFLNQPAPAAAEGDRREVIRIVEVIPHEACSIFPYLIEWGSKEEYDKNTPLGYDGIRYMASSMTGNTQFNSYNGIYSYSDGGVTSPTLTDYSVNLTTKNSSNGSDLWWREVEIDSNITASGYFEYVGNNKGLYSINLNPDNIIKAENTTDHGIRYRVKAMERKENEAPKGEWQVKDPAYYWSKNSNGSYPTNDIKQIPEYNYDLKFLEASSGSSTDFTYRAEKFTVKLSESVEDGRQYDYQARLKDESSWSAGYTYWDKGNYAVNTSSVVANTVTEADITSGLNNLVGKYIRIQNEEKTDGIAGMPAGYFRLYSEESDKSKIVAGDTYYELAFQSVAPGNGKYVLSPTAVNTTTNIETFVFEYAGEGKGTCEVNFIYSNLLSGVTLYTADIVRITDGEGTYALTSKEPSEDNLYVKVSDEKGDYSKVITNIDCLGIDYNTSSQGWYGDGEQPVGLCVGQINSNPDTSLGYLGEKGDWVFHTVSSDETNGITKLEELEDGKIPKRIYVYNQNRKNRYYAQHGFVSNEWFKLLIYMANEDDTQGLAAADYAAGKSGKEILERYKDNIAAFDQKYRIEIIQRTPSKLTVDEVENADLIYIAQSVGIYVLQNSSDWEKIDDHIAADLPPMPDPLRFADGDVISDEVLMAIYKNCLYHEDGKTPTTALMLDAPALRESGYGHMSGTRTVDNFGKLYYFVDLFDDPAEFANFINGYMENTEHWENNDGYSTILPTDGCKVSLYMNDHGLYNQGIIHINNKTDLEQTYDDQWEVKYFQVRKLIDNGSGYMNADWNDSGVLNGALESFMNNNSIYGKDVEENSGRTWYAPYTYGHIFENPGQMLNIFRIMHNRTSKKTSTPKVLVTNADYTKIPDMQNTAVSYYFYLDEYMMIDADAFYVNYKVSWTPEEVTDPNALSSLVVKRAATGDVIQSQDSPAYETEYTCDVRGDFVDAEGGWNGTRMMQYLITATDEKGKSDTVSVFVIFRDSFMLN